MPGLTIYILAGAVLAALLLVMVAFSGPSAAKLQARRLESDISRSPFSSSTCSCWR